MYVAVLVALWGGCFLPTSTLLAGPAPATLDRSGYVRLLHLLVAALDVAPGASPAVQGAAATRGLSLIPEQLYVVEGGVTLADIDSTPLRAPLLQQPPDLAGTRDHALALLALLDPGSIATPTARATPTPGGLGTPGPVAYIPGSGAAGPPLAADAAGRRLDQVLADARFQSDVGTGLQSGLARLLQPAVAFFLQLPSRQRNLLIAAVAGLLVAFLIFSGYHGAPWTRGRLVGSMAGGGLGTASAVFLLLTYFGPLFGMLGSAALPVFGTLGALATAGVLFVLIGGMRRARAPHTAVTPGAFSAEAGWTAQQARGAAGAAAAAGDFRRAVRYRFLATLLALDEADRVRFDPALTDGEYLRRAPEPLQATLLPLVRAFERFWYGGYPASEGDYQQYQALAAGAEQAGRPDQPA